MSEYIGLNGVPFGEEEIQSWINDIDSGFPNTYFEKTPPRAWETELPPMEAKNMAYTNQELEAIAAEYEHGITPKHIALSGSPNTQENWYEQ